MFRDRRHPSRPVCRLQPQRSGKSRVKFARGAKISFVSRTERPPLLILGASTRAAAYSALRAGRQPICADLFADEDLRAVATVLAVDSYPHGLVAAARQAPPCPWMYTGALENHPQVVAAISQDRPLWGNPPEVLRAARDPFRVHSLLAARKLPVLEIRLEDDPPPPDGCWLRKPIRSAAGRRISIWNGCTAETLGLSEPHYFQRRAAGRPVSALYLAAGSHTLLIGITRQLVGTSRSGAPPFAYCGSIGPIQLPPQATRQIRRTGEVLAAGCGLRGLFGIDFVYDSRNARPTEINPRYTASVEIFEHGCEIDLLDWHRRAFAEGLESPQAREMDSSSVERIVAKMILFAKRELCTVSLDGFREPADAGRGSRPRDIPTLADVPAAGTVIAAGRPICTVFASGATGSQCLRRLANRARKILGLLHAVFLEPVPPPR